MILGGRLLLLIIIMDVFLYFGMSAVNMPEAPSFGTYAGHFVDMDASVNENVSGYINYSSGNTIMQSSTFGWISAGISEIINFVGVMFEVMTAPLNFATLIGAPLFVRVLVGSTYIVLVLSAIAQLITGRIT